MWDNWISRVRLMFSTRRIAVAEVPAPLLICALLSGCGDNLQLPRAWGVGVATFDSTSLGLGATNDSFPIVSAKRLVIPTYDGSGQNVHPDVLREPERLLMAITPYPYSNGDLENPSLVVSDDGIVFRELEPGLNPLVGPPPYDHNDDPDLHVDPATGEYEILYLETLRPDAQNVISLRSRDLTTWTRTTAISYDLAHGAPFIVSPSVIVHGGVSTMFSVRLLNEGSVIERFDSPDGRTWDATQATPIAIDTGAVIAWHIDVFAVPAGYAMLISGYETDFTFHDLYLATSTDLARWTFHPEPLLAYDDPALDVETLYRSTGFVSGDRLIVWYSHQYRE